MLKLEALDKSHDRTSFDCGREPLNRFLREVARMHMERGISQTFVLVDKKAKPPKPLLGFFSLGLLGFGLCFAFGIPSRGLGRAGAGLVL
jgi:hypothetical protein